MKWLSGAQQMEVQKCPMCNSDITVEILEKAIEEESNAKQVGNRSIFGVGGSPMKDRRAGGGARNANRQPRVAHGSTDDAVMRLESLRSSNEGLPSRAIGSLDNAVLGN